MSRMNIECCLHTSKIPLGRNEKPLSSGTPERPSEPPEQWLAIFRFSNLPADHAGGSLTSLLAWGDRSPPWAPPDTAAAPSQNEPRPAGPHPRTSQAPEPEGWNSWTRKQRHISPQRAVRCPGISCAARPAPRQRALTLASRSFPAPAPLSCASFLAIQLSSSRPSKRTFARSSRALTLTSHSLSPSQHPRRRWTSGGRGFLFCWVPASGSQDQTWNLHFSTLALTFFLLRWRWQLTLLGALSVVRHHIYT